MSELLNHPRWVDDLGSPLTLYDGPVVHEWGVHTVNGDGGLWLDWFPSPRVFASWGFDHPSGMDTLLRADNVEVVLPGVCGGGRVRLGGAPDRPRIKPHSDRHPVTLAGSIDRFVIGNDVPVEEVRFLVVNGPELLGSRLDDGDGGFWAGRTILESVRWRFVLDQRQDMSRIEGDLRWGVPFGFTHIGQLVRRDGEDVTLAETAEALTLLSYFMSFVRGASVSAVFPCGLDAAGATVWEDWGSVNGTVDPWRVTFSWFDMTLTGHLPQLFSGFAKRWGNPADQQVLRYALAFYGGGNVPRPLQTGLTLSVSGLELMAWVYLVRDGSMELVDFEEPGARARTFKQLLEVVGIDTSRVPDDLAALRSAGQLGPDAIWSLRSRFTHPRTETIGVQHDILEEAWRLGTWYLELSLLHWFGYTGEYGSRLKPGRWQGDTEPMPWSEGSRS